MTDVTDGGAPSTGSGANLENAPALKNDQLLMRVEGLSRYFDVSPPLLNRIFEGRERLTLRAVDDVSFDIERGETLGLVGESGSGKSTVARCLVGLHAPTGGRILFENVEMIGGSKDSFQPIRHRMQMIFQDPFASLNPRWRVSNIIAEPVRAFGLMSTRSEISARVDELLNLVGLTPADGRKFPHEFSGGQRQRISIARALASNPDFLICDEPTSALDVSVQAQILNLMRDLQAEFGLTYLFISHDLSVIAHMSNKVGVMYLGRIVELRNANELFDNPLHPYTRLLLDTIPSLDNIGVARAPLAGEVPNPLTPPTGCAFHPRCPFADDRCRTERPKSHAVAGGHVTCHGVEEGRIAEGDLGV
jgi:peptide/nickel transport system ATP-binding protein